MVEDQNRAFGRRSSTGWTLALLSLGALTLTSCASKTAALHPAPFFSPTPTREATNAVDAGDGDLEIAGLRRTMMSHPEDVDARLRLAQAYAARGFADVALEHYRLATERFPESLKAAVALARALRKADQKEEAFAGLKTFILAHPQNSAEAYAWLGILNDDLRDWKASQAAYETALLYSPASAELHNNLGYSFLMQDLKDAAAAEFRAALRINHNLPIARNNLGIAMAANPKEAILNWQAISGPAAAHNNMAALLIERGNYPEARKELETALGYDQHNAQAIYNLALVAERDGKPAVLASQKVKQPGILARFFHPGHAAKAAENRTAPANQTAVSRNVQGAAPSAASGSGN